MSIFLVPGVRSLRVCATSVVVYGRDLIIITIIPHFVIIDLISRKERKINMNTGLMIKLNKPELCLYVNSYYRPSRARCEKKARDYNFVCYDTDIQRVQSQ